MSGQLATPRKILVALFFVLSPFLTHFLLAAHGSSLGPLSAGLLLSQGLLISLMIGTRLQRPFRLPAIACVLAGALILAIYHLHGGLVLSVGAQHAAIYMGLLAVFGVSLFPGREPIVTFFARTIHGDISREIETYTRRVTWVWCGFFGLQLAGSALLLTMAPLSWWSIFVNILNLPLVAALMLGEKVTRRFWVSDPPREYLRDFLRMPILLREGLKKPGTQSL
jgi:uncharacterized membrane protein